jgi:hypothetical protein
MNWQKYKEQQQDQNDRTHKAGTRITPHLIVIIRRRGIGLILYDDDTGSSCKGECFEKASREGWFSSTFCTCITDSEANTEGYTAAGYYG